MELEGECDRTGDLDVVEPTGWDSNRITSREMDGSVWFVVEHEGQLTRVDDESSPDTLGDAMSAK